jgi:uncharacterized membrane protein YiaA
MKDNNNYYICYDIYFDVCIYICFIIGLYIFHIGFHNGRPSLYYKIYLFFLLLQLIAKSTCTLTRTNRVNNMIDTLI